MIEQLQRTVEREASPDELRDSLSQSTAYLSTLVASMPHPFFFLNEQLIVEVANEAFARYADSAPAAVIGSHAREVLGEDRFAELRPCLERALAGEESEYASTVALPNQGRRFFRVASRPARDGNGLICGVFSEFIDVTDLRRLEQQARESEERFRMVAQGVPNFLFIVNRDLCVEFCNDHFLENTARTLDDIVGRHVSEVVGARYGERRDYYLRALAGETVTCEESGVAGNEDGFFRLQYQPCYDDCGEIWGVFSVATDITLRRKAELDLEAKQEELLRSNQDLEQFAYVASHDLKAPLRAMALLVEWIREDLGDYDSGNLQENLGLLEQRTYRLGRLLDDLLTYSRVGRKVGEFRMTNVGELVNDIVEMAGMPEHVTISIENELPQFETYRAPLEQVFRNLIGNAVKHHPGPEAKIAISCVDEGEAYVFSVADDGDGIPEEYAERVFQMFQTLKPRDEVEGSGMGLAIVQRILAWHGGRVWFEPAPGGRGTIFRFRWNKIPRQRTVGLITEA